MARGKESGVFIEGRRRRRRRGREVYERGRYGIEQV